MSEVLIFQNLKFAHDSASKPLFDGLDAHFPKGWTGVAGPNGAGKTTLLKLAAGILQPQGRSVNENTPKSRQHSGLSPRFLPWMNPPTISTHLRVSFWHRP